MPLNSYHIARLQADQNNFVTVTSCDTESLPPILVGFINLQLKDIRLVRNMLDDVIRSAARMYSMVQIDWTDSEGNDHQRFVHHGPRMNVTDRLAAVDTVVADLLSNI